MKLLNFLVVIYGCHFQEGNSRHAHSNLHLYTAMNSQDVFWSRKKTNDLHCIFLHYQFTPLSSLKAFMYVMALWLDLRHLDNLTVHFQLHITFH